MKKLAPLLCILALTTIFTSVQFYRTDLAIINGRDVGIVELITPAVDTDIYNLIWFTDIDGRLMMATFNCTVELEEEWKGVANRILESFRVE